jgi:hypothetical protein
MNEVITATMTFDEPTMLVARHWHNRANRTRRLIRVALLALVALAVFMSLFGAMGGMLTAAAFALGCALLGLALGHAIERNRFVSGIKSSPLFGAELSFVFDTEGTAVTSPHSNARIGWQMFHKTLATPDGVLLYQQKYLFNWLPKTAFNSAADYNRFLDFLAAKTKHSKLS